MVVQRAESRQLGASGEPSASEDGEPDAVVVMEGADEDLSESVLEPAKVMRVAIMVRQLLDEFRQTPLDEGGRTRLSKIHEQSIRELASTLSPDLAQELERMTRPFQKTPPSEAELHVAQAQLVGWLEGLFRGIQAAIFSQQVEAQLQLEKLRERGSSEQPRTSNAANTAPDTGSYL